MNDTHFSDLITRAVIFQNEKVMVIVQPLSLTFIRKNNKTQGNEGDSIGLKHLANP